jgi:hypothetical protein
MHYLASTLEIKKASLCLAIAKGIGLWYRTTVWEFVSRAGSGLRVSRMTSLEGVCQRAVTVAELGGVVLAGVRD